ncbi:tape measure protein [Pediococcus acidilactici]|uniref:tape measure protein n=2 Tax=Pediococcus acidilactici TaxID=1254 RepID=UPI00232FCB65|nr:tape measure protein [Pediococcus acidilactici]MDB8870896.1 tape measure protein [Pediococcus acidilactici]MDB8878643.1 tape measure protein [Pediococcus acidilactici]
MADGTINIDVLLHKEKFLPDYESIKNLLTNLGTNTGDKMDQDFTANADKMANKARSAHDRIREEMGKTVKQVIKADTTEFGEKVSRADRSRQKFKNPVKQRFKADFSGFNRGIKGATRQIDTLKEHTHRIRDVMAGTFAGTLITNGLTAIVNGLKAATQAGMAYNKEQDTMRTVWTALTTEAPRDGKELVNYINSLSQHSIYAADTIDRMAQSFYHVHSNVKETKDWTNAFVALGSTLHMSNDALAESGEQFAKIVAGGKASAEDMAVMINRFPMFGEALQKATGKSMKQLYAMSAAGKMTATQFTDALDYLGKKYKGGTAEAMTSFQGMTMYMQSRWQVLTGKIMNSSFKLTKSAAKDLRDLMSDDMMEKYAKLVSGAISKVTEGVASMVHYIDKNKSSIVDIFGSIGEIVGLVGKGAWDEITGMFKMIPGVKSDGIKGVAEGLKEIAKHKDAVENVGKVLVTYFMAKKMVSAAHTIWDIYKGIKGIASIPVNGIRKVMDALSTTPSAGSSVVDAAAMTRGERFGTAKASKGLLGGIASKLMPKGLASKMLSFGKGLGGKLVAGLGLALSAFDLVKAFTTKDQNKKAENAGKGIGGLLGAGIGFALGGPAGAAIGNIIGDLAGGWVVKATKKFGNGWNDWAKGYKPHGIIAKIGFDTHEAMFKLNNFTAKVEKKHPKIAPVIRIADGVIKGMWKAIMLPEKTFATSFGLAGKEAADLFSGRFDKMWPDFVKTSKSFLGSVIDDAKNVWDTITGNRHVDKKPKSKKSKKSKKDIAEDEAIEAMGTVKVSKKDIANVKAMIPVMKQYESALDGLKKFLKKNDPTKELNSMNKRLKRSVDGWDKLAKPIKKIGDAFRALNSFADSMKKDPFAQLNHDLPKLDNTLKNVKIGDNLKKLKADLEHNNPTKTVDKISESLSKNNKKWKSFSKSSSKAAESIDKLVKSMKGLDSNNAFYKLQTQIVNLESVLRNTKISASLNTLKTGLKNNNPTNEIKAITKGLKDNNPKDTLKAITKQFTQSSKTWDKFAKSSRSLTAGLNSLELSLKPFQKDRSFNNLNKDIANLDKTLMRNKIGDSLKKLKKDLKNNNPSKELKAVSKEIRADAKDWGKLAKPIKSLAKSFDSLSRSMRSIEKNKGVARLNSDLTKLERTAKKSRFGSELSKQFSIANKAAGDTGFVKVFHNMTNSIVRDLNRFKSTFERDWERLWKDAANDEKKDVNKIESDLSSSTNKMLKTENSFSNSFEKTWKSLGNTLRSSWKSVWKDIADLSNSGMHKTAGYINSGIQGIDYVLGKFGGSPKTISPIKFASGTGLVENGRLTRGTLAMLNDGNDSPETNNVERVVKADGSSYEPAGNNVLHYLEPGDAVLNATENKMFKMSGLTHFADGTGIFSSSLFKGVNGGYQQLIELAERLSSNVNKSFAALFSKKPKIKGDVPKAFETVFKKQADKQGQKWWATVWDVINEAIGGASGDATGLLKAVEKYGTGKPYVWGATGPDSFDCSGLVMYALKQAFGISYPHFSGDQIARTQHISKDQLRPGDLIGNDEHIGVYAGNGKYWSAMSPSSHPNIGMSPVSTFPGTPIYGRVRGLKSEDDKKKKDTKADKGLVGLVKKELGPGVFSFIKKHLAPLVTDSDGVGTASGGKVSGDLIREAAKIAGVSISASDIRHIENVIQHESGGNPTIVNHTDDNAKAGHPSKGILQFIDSTFRHYAMPGHGNILSALDQLVAMFNDTTWRSDLTLGGWGPTGAVRHANGGWGQWGKLNIFNEVPGEPEVAINPSRATADDLIMETIAERLKKAPNGKLAHALNAISHVPEQAHQFAGKAIANISNPTNTGANVATAGEGCNINTVINLDGKVIADATYPINQARQSKQITIETKKRGGFH